VGCALSIAKCTCDVPSTFISPFCHRKAKDFIILTVLHTHQVRLAGPQPAPGEPGQELRALWETEVGSLEALGDHTGSSTEESKALPSCWVSELLQTRRISVGMR